MNNDNKVLLVGFDKKIEEKLQFFSQDIHLGFFRGSFESLKDIYSTGGRLVEYNKILLAPVGNIYFPETIDISTDSTDNYIYLENDNIRVNDNLIFQELGLIDLILDTRFRKPKTATTIFLPDLQKIDVDFQKLNTKIKTAFSELKDNKTYRISFTEPERNYLGTIALYSFVKSFLTLDNSSIITPESRKPDKYYINCKADILKSKAEIFSSFKRFISNSEIKSDFETVLDSWKYENSEKGNKPNKAFNSLLKGTVNNEKSHEDLKEEFTKLLENDRKAAYSKFNIIDIRFRNFYDFPEHYFINLEEKNLSNPLIIYPEFETTDDAVYSILPFVYPVIAESEHTYTVEGETFEYPENDWPPKTNIFLNKVRDDFNRSRASDAKPEFIGNSKNLTYWANEIAVATRTSKGHILISGETGSGKEMTAEIIHYFSFGEKSSGFFAAVNCADIPESLADSILFGHLKGSFTGAVADKKGLIFNSQKGSLFLDEINQLPKETLGKLLRFMETGEFHKLGESEQSSSEVRIIAATNSLDFVEDKSLNSSGLINRFMFFVNIPALRYRTDDIPVLAEYFWNKALNEYCNKKDRIILEAEELISKLNSRKENIIKELSQRLWINSNVRGLRNEVYNIINRFIAVEELKAPTVANILQPRNKRTNKTVTYISDEEFIGILKNSINRNFTGQELKSILLKASNGGYSSISSVKMKLSRMKKRGFSKEAELLQKQFTKSGKFRDY